VPAAWLLMVQAMMALLAGVWGLLVGTPLVVVCMVAVQQLYIRDRLGKDVSITGDRNDDP